MILTKYCFTSAPSCVSSSFIIIYLLAPEKAFSVESTCISLLPCVSSHRYILLGLSYLVNLTSSCSLIPTELCLLSTDRCIAFSTLISRGWSLSTDCRTAYSTLMMRGQVQNPSSFPKEENLSYFRSKITLRVDLFYTQYFNNSLLSRYGVDICKTHNPYRLLKTQKVDGRKWLHHPYQATSSTR